MEQSKLATPGTSDAATAAEIMASRGENDAAAALRAYRLLDAEAGGNFWEPTSPPGSMVAAAAPLLLAKQTADALLSWIRCSTAGNSLVIANNGQVVTSDTVDKQLLWAEHAPKVLQLISSVGVDLASDAELQQMYAEATMYYACSQGVVQAFVTGKALKFLSAVNSLANKFPTQDNGIAFIMRGSYYMAAPWPVRSVKKARANYEKAVEVNGRSRRNLFYAGLGRLACGDFEGAKEMFSTASSDDKCNNASVSERDVAATLMEQAKRGLDYCARLTEPA